MQIDLKPEHLLPQFARSMTAFCAPDPELVREEFREWHYADRVKT
jgi:hypothetical protein